MMIELVEDLQAGSSGSGDQVEGERSLQCFVHPIMMCNGILNCPNCVDEIYEDCIRVNCFEGNFSENIKISCTFPALYVALKIFAQAMLDAVMNPVSVFELQSCVTASEIVSTTGTRRLNNV